MNKTNIIVGVIAVVALIVGGLAYIKVPATQASSGLQTYGAVGGTVMPNGKVLPNPSVLDYFLARVALETDGPFLEGGATVATGIIEQPQITSCNQGIYAGSSTQFAIKNPNSATSTLTVLDVTATGQATTTTFLVGTSTTPGGNGSTGISATFVNATLSTSSLAFYTPGVTVGSGSGFTNAGSGTFMTIQVGPNDWVVGEATTTATGAGAAGFVPGITCLLKGQWTI